MTETKNAAEIAKQIRELIITLFEMPRRCEDCYYYDFDDEKGCQKFCTRVPAIGCRDHVRWDLEEIFEEYHEVASQWKYLGK